MGRMTVGQGPGRSAIGLGSETEGFFRVKAVESRRQQGVRRAAREKEAHGVVSGARNELHVARRGYARAVFGSFRQQEVRILFAEPVVGGRLVLARPGKQAQQAAQANAFAAAKLYALELRGGGLVDGQGVRGLQGAVGRRHVASRLVSETARGEMVESGGDGPQVGVHYGGALRMEFAALFEEFAVRQEDISGTRMIGRQPGNFVAYGVAVARNGCEGGFHGQEGMPLFVDPDGVARRRAKAVAMDIVLAEQVGHDLVPPARARRRNEVVPVEGFHGARFGDQQAQAEQFGQPDFVFDIGQFPHAGFEHLIFAPPFYGDRLARYALLRVFIDERAGLPSPLSVHEVPVPGRVRRLVGIRPFVRVHLVDFEEFAAPVVHYAQREVVVLSLPIDVQGKEFPEVAHQPVAHARRARFGMFLKRIDKPRTEDHVRMHVEFFQREAVVVRPGLGIRDRRRAPRVRVRFAHGKEQQQQGGGCACGGSYYSGAIQTTRHESDGAFRVAPVLAGFGWPARSGV